MTSTKDSPQAGLSPSYRIDLQPVQDYCPHYQAISLYQLWVAGQGWINSPYPESLTVDEQVSLAIGAGATHFCFAIQDKQNQMRYPDFGIREITDPTYGLDDMTPLQR